MTRAFLCCALITISLLTYSQKLKKTRDGISGKTTWTTSKVTIFKKRGIMSTKAAEKLEFNFIKIDSFIFLNIYCQSPDKQAGSINIGQELEMNVGGDKVVTAYAIANFIPAGDFKGPYSDFIWKWEASYQITKEFWELLSKNRTTFLRVTTQFGIYDFDIKKSDEDLVMDAFNLLVNK